MAEEIPRHLAEDPWFKVVDMLQHNWAVVIVEDEAARILFFGDTCGIFDEIIYQSEAEAKSALRRNGFAKYSEDAPAREFIGIPKGEFYRTEHPNGAIYSSGRFWH